jgi:RNA polymerase sigma-70 factor, ECF subfamily
MNPAITHAPALPDDPVSKGLEETGLREELLKHALACLARSSCGQSMVDRMDKAREVIQATYLRALQKRDTFDPTRAIRPWVHGILNNVLSEFVRSMRHSPTQQPADVATWESIAVDLAPDAAKYVLEPSEVVECLVKLPQEHREILQLRFYEDLSHEQIAVRLAISPGNARVRLSRALTAVRQLAGEISREVRP